MTRIVDQILITVLLAVLLSSELCSSWLPQQVVASPVTLAPPLDTAATRRLQRDNEADTRLVPEPVLYFEDREDGSKLLIWEPEETLARDVLARRSEVWLYTLLVANKASLEALPGFLEHYTKLGIQVDRMVFMINHNPLNSTETSSLQCITSALAAWGADYRLWVGQPTSKSHMEVELVALHRVPVQDWIVVVMNELLDFDGAVDAAKFLQAREREGASWVGTTHPNRHKNSNSNTQGACESNQQNAELIVNNNCSTTRVVAMRGFLRTDACSYSIIPPEEAISYFGSLYHLTPYVPWQVYYRTPLMTGNAFLWEIRPSDTQITVYRRTTEYQNSAGDGFESFAECQGEEASSLDGEGTCPGPGGEGGAALEGPEAPRGISTLSDQDKKALEAVHQVVDTCVS